MENEIIIEGISILDFLNSLNDKIVLHLENEKNLGVLRKTHTHARGALNREASSIRKDLKVLKFLGEDALSLFPEENRKEIRNKMERINGYFSLREGRDLEKLNSAVVGLQIYLEILKTRENFSEDFLIGIIANQKAAT